MMDKIFKVYQLAVEIEAFAHEPCADPERACWLLKGARQSLYRAQWHMSPDVACWQADMQREAAE